MKTNRNFQSTLRLPRAAFLGAEVGSERGGTEVETTAMVPEAEEAEVAVRGTQEMSVMFGTECVDRSSPERVDWESPEKVVETSSVSAESPREDFPSVEFDPSVREFWIEKYAV